MTITRINRPRHILVKGAEKLTKAGDRNGMAIYGDMKTGDLDKRQRERLTKVRDDKKTTFSDILKTAIYDERIY